MSMVHEHITWEHSERTRPSKRTLIEKYRWVMRPLCRDSGYPAVWNFGLNDTVGVEPGDLFLFFGWFHAVERIGGMYQYVRDSGDFFRDCDLHVIWGYLQVGEIIRNYAEKAARFPWHPHADPSRRDSENDAIFVARKHLSFAPSLPGAGLLPFDRKRVLTLEGEKRATWKPNPVYMPNAIVNQRKNSVKGAGVYYSGIWQELALKETKRAEQWAMDMILNKPTRRMR